MPNFSVSLNADLSVQDDNTGDIVVKRLISFLKDLFAYTTQQYIYIGPATGNPYIITAFGAAGGTNPTNAQIQLAFIKNNSPNAGMLIDVTFHFFNLFAGAYNATITLDAGDFIFIQDSSKANGKSLAQIDINPNASFTDINSNIPVEYFVAG